MGASSYGPFSRDHVTTKAVLPECSLIQDTRTGVNYFLFELRLSPEQYAAEARLWDARPVSTRLPKVVHHQLANSMNCKSPHTVLITEAVETRLQQFWKIPDSDALTVGIQAMRGYSQLAASRQLNFKVTDSMIGFDKQQVKVWLSRDFSRNDPENSALTKDSAQISRAIQILQLLQTHARNPGLFRSLKGEASECRSLAEVASLLQRRQGAR